MASCSGDDEPAPLNPDGTRTVTITVSATDEMQTRAISETEDDAITRCLIQVMNGSTTEVAATAMTAGSNNTYTYTANLDRNSSYTFLFWADDGSYTASDLTSVTAGSTVGIAYATTASWNGTDASITANLQLVVSKVTLGPGQHLTISGDIAGLAQTPVTLSAIISDSWDADYRGFGSVDTYTDATQASASLTGSGTSAAPYLITSAADFACFMGDRDYCRSGAHIRLMTDIDIQASSWKPIDIFGNFDGNGHTISGTLNCTISNSSEPGIEEDAGLFGSVTSSTIHDLNVTADVNVGGGSPDQQACYAGGIAGRGRYGTISRCTYTGTLDVSVTANYRIYAGGIAGNAQVVTISSCTHTGTIRTEGSTGDIQVGGIVGRNQNATLTGNVWEDGIPNKETGDE